MEPEGKKRYDGGRTWQEYSALERAVTFPEEINPEKADGDMKKGVPGLKGSKKKPRPEAGLESAN